MPPCWCSDVLGSCMLWLVEERVSLSTSDHDAKFLEEATVLQLYPSSVATMPSTLYFCANFVISSTFLVVVSPLLHIHWANSISISMTCLVLLRRCFLVSVHVLSHTVLLNVLLRVLYFFLSMSISCYCSCQSSITFPSSHSDTSPFIQASRVSNKDLKSSYEARGQSICDHLTPPCMHIISPSPWCMFSIKLWCAVARRVDPWHIVHPEVVCSSIQHPSLIPCATGEGPPSTQPVPSSSWARVSSLPCTVSSTASFGLDPLQWRLLELPSSDWNSSLSSGGLGVFSAVPPLCQRCFLAEAHPYFAG